VDGPGEEGEVGGEVGGESALADTCRDRGSVSQSTRVDVGQYEMFPVA
jgi:hypothetical protein